MTEKSVMFNLYKAEIHKAVRYPIYVIVPAQILLFMLATLFLLFWLFPSPAAGVSERMALGAFLVLIAVNICCALFWNFYNLGLMSISPNILTLTRRGRWKKRSVSPAKRISGFLPLFCFMRFYKAKEPILFSGVC